MTAAPPLQAVVRATVDAIPDPELPIVSIGDLGMVHDVAVGSGEDDAIQVAILPTFLGCPAVDLLRATIRDELVGFGRPVEVHSTTVIPWTTERITPAGLAALAAVGIAAPADDPADVRCPWCASARVVMDSAFGPTPCRSLLYCRDCRQPFEALKPV